MSVAYPNPRPTPTPPFLDGLLPKQYCSFLSPLPPLPPPFFNSRVEINSVHHMGEKYGMILKIFIVKSSGLLLQKKNIKGIKEVRIIF